MNLTNGIQIAVRASMRIAASLAGSLFLLISACTNSSVDTGPGVDKYQLAIGVIDATPNVSHDVAVCTNNGLEFKVLSDTAYRVKRLNVNPAWRPDGKAVAYINSTDGITSVVVADLETGTRTSINGVLPDERFAPAWSPTGTLIAIRSILSNSIQIVSVTGAVQSTLQAERWNSVPGQAFWTSDGTRIAVADGNNAVVVFDAAGIELANITNTGLLFGWNANGTELITSKKLGADSLSVDRWNVETKLKTHVATIGVKGAYSFGSVAGSNAEMHVINSDSITVINTLNGELSGIVATQRIVKSSLSSDGKYLAYLTPDASSYAMHIVDMDTKEDRRIRTAVNVLYSPVIKKE